MNTTATVLDGEAARLVHEATPLDELEVRYLRKAIRYRLGLRGTPAGRRLAPGEAGRLERERAAELERMADWIVQAGA